jgi:hypothetical protein
VRLALLILVLLAQDASKAAEDIAVHRSWTGDSTRLDRAEYHRITDVDAWTVLWQRHVGKKERAPEVDFDKHMIVAAFLGRVAYDHAAVHAVKKTKDELVVGLEVESEDCCDFSLRPLYLIAVVPRSDLKLSIISRVRSGTDIDPRQDELLKEFAKLD